LHIFIDIGKYLPVWIVRVRFVAIKISLMTISTDRAVLIDGKQMVKRMQRKNKPNEKFLTSIRNILFRIICYGMLWMVLAGGRTDSWLIGVPAVIVASLISSRAPDSTSNRFSISGSIWFTGFFLKASLISGIDVVRRAFHPKILLDPDLIDYRLSLSTEAARIFMADAVSLLPGTLSTDLAGEKLTIHVLDRNMPISADLRALERRVATMLESNHRPLFSRKGIKS
jgi:multicomponent Na+:H+ antiporter subunit E